MTDDSGLAQHPVATRGPACTAIGGVTPVHVAEAAAAGEPSTVAPTEDERWAEADSILRRKATPSAVASQRKRRKRVWLTVVGVALLSGAIGGVIGGLAASGDHVHSADQASTWQYIVGFTLSTLGILGGAAALVSLIRSGQWGAAWRSPTTALTRQQRKDLLRQVRGQRAADPEHLALARHLARQLVIQRRQALLMTSLLLLWIGQVIVFPDLLHVALFGLFVVLGPFAIALILRDARRAQRFLDEHPGPVPATPADGGAGSE